MIVKKAGLRVSTGIVVIAKNRSMHLHLNQMVKTSIKGIRETIRMVHIEMLTLRSMHLHLNQMVKRGMKDRRETIGMVHREMLTLRSLKMGNLVRGKVGSYIILQISNSFLL